MTKPILTSFEIKKIINSAVIGKDSDTILGHVSDIIIEPSKNRIFALLIRTYSIIPLSRIVLYRNITEFSKGKIIVKSENSITNSASCKFPSNSLLYKAETDNKYIYKSKNESILQTPVGIIKNARFDAETGAISEFVISKQKHPMPWSKNEKISVNKFKAIDNTIIID